MKTKQLIYPAFFLLGLLISTPTFSASYEEGREAYLAKDYEKALAILAPIANDGHAKAQISLGVMYDFGHGVEQNSVEAIRWYEMAAEQGNSVVQHDLGVKYFKGSGIPQNYEKAANWWHKAAENGVAESQYNLGILYTRGLGYEKNTAEAIKWYSKAASQGHAHAQYSLGVMYSFGQGVEQSYSKAASYFSDAAEQNIAQAQYNLAVLLEHGRGVDVDIPRAKKWYSKAAEQDVAQAAERLTLLNESKKADDKESKKDEDKPEPQQIAKPKPVTEAKITLADVEVEVEEIKAKDVALPTNASMEQSSKPAVEMSQAEITAKLAEVDKHLPNSESKSSKQSDTTSQALPAKEIMPTAGTASPEVVEAVDKGNNVEAAVKSTLKEAKPLEAAEVSSAEKRKKVTQEITEQAPEISTADKDLEALKQRQAAYAATPGPLASTATMATKEAPSRSEEASTNSGQATGIAITADNNEWIRSQNPEHYTLQMIAFREKDNATRYLENLDLEGEKAIYKSSMHGKTIYKVIYGKFENHKASLKARRSLPAEYRKTSPFPRTFKFLQSDIKE